MTAPVTPAAETREEGLVAMVMAREDQVAMAMTTKDVRVATGVINMEARVAPMISRGVWAVTVSRRLFYAIHLLSFIFR
jgi:hypothetical protein